MSDQRATNAHDEPGGVPPYETRDASVRGLLWFGVGLILSCVVIEFIMYRFFGVFVHETKVERPESPESAPANKPLYNLYTQLRQLHEEEDRSLEGYSWVDRKAGVVRIPIERAMELVASKGVRFGKGPKTELELNSHGGIPAPTPADEPAKAAAPATTGGDAAKPQNPPDTTGSKP